LKPETRNSTSNPANRLDSPGCCTFWKVHALQNRRQTKYMVRFL